VVVAVDGSPFARSSPSPSSSSGSSPCSVDRAILPPPPESREPPSFPVRDSPRQGLVLPVHCPRRPLGPSTWHRASPPSPIRIPHRGLGRPHGLGCLIRLHPEKQVERRRRTDIVVVGPIVTSPRGDPPPLAGRHPMFYISGGHIPFPFPFPFPISAVHATWRA
jgi:hypothetical protein